MQSTHHAVNTSCSQHPTTTTHNRVDPQVCFIAAASTGAHLATVEVRPPVGWTSASGIYCLRIWDAIHDGSGGGGGGGYGQSRGSSSAAAPFVLNSTFDQPHGYVYMSLRMCVCCGAYPCSSVCLCSPTHHLLFPYPPLVPAPTSFPPLPHNTRSSPVSSCSYHPGSDLVATTCSGAGHWDAPTGEEGQCKLWTKVQGVSGGPAGAAGSGTTTAGDKPVYFWRCSATLSYKGLPMTASCFSDDGSVLAVGCVGLVALWNVDDVSPCARIPLPGGGDAVPMCMAVVPDTPYLVRGRRVCCGGGRGCGYCYQID